MADTTAVAREATMDDEAREVIARAKADHDKHCVWDDDRVFADRALAALRAAGYHLMRWRRVRPNEPEDFKTVLVRHEDDLFPVPAYRMPGAEHTSIWHYEQDGPEDGWDEGDHRHTALKRSPTYWADLPLPCDAVPPEAKP